MMHFLVAKSPIQDNLTENKILRRESNAVFLLFIFSYPYRMSLSDSSMGLLVVLAIAALGIALLCVCCVAYFLLKNIGKMYNELSESSLEHGKAVPLLSTTAKLSNGASIIPV